MNLTYANNLVVRHLRDAADPRLQHLIDLADLLDDEESDYELVMTLAAALDRTLVEIVERLGRVDVVALREVVA